MGSNPGRAPPLERHDKGSRTRFGLLYFCDPSALRWKTQLHLHFCMIPVPNCPVSFVFLYCTGIKAIRATWFVFSLKKPYYFTIYWVILREEMLLASAFTTLWSAVLKVRNLFLRLSNGFVFNRTLSFVLQTHPWSLEPKVLYKSSNWLPGYLVLCVPYSNSLKCLKLKISK